MRSEVAKELQNNQLWGEIVGELDHKIYLISNKLHTCTQEQLPLLQNEIRILQGIKRLPDDVIGREEDVDGLQPR